MGKLVIEQVKTGLFVAPTESGDAIAKQAKKTLEAPIGALDADVYFSIRGHLRDGTLQPYVEVRVERPSEPEREETGSDQPYGHPAMIKTVVRMDFYTSLKPGTLECNVLSVLRKSDGSCTNLFFRDWAEVLGVIMRLVRTIPTPPAFDPSFTMDFGSTPPNR